MSVIKKNIIMLLAASVMTAGLSMQAFAGPDLSGDPSLIDGTIPSLSGDYETIEESWSTELSDLWGDGVDLSVNWEEGYKTDADATEDMNYEQKLIYLNAIKEYKEIVDPKPIENAMKILTFNSTDSTYTQLQNFINTMLKVTYPIGMGLTVLFFLVSIADSASRQMMTVEEMIKCTIQFVIAAMLVSNCGKLMSGGLAFASSLLAKMTGGGMAVTGDEALQNLMAHFRAVARDQAARYDTGSAVKGVYSVLSITPAGLLKELLELLGDWIVKIFIYLAAFTRVIDLSIRMIFCPIAISNVYHRGMDSPGMRYIKKIFAVELQAVLILVVVQVVTFLKYAGVGADGTFLLSDMFARASLNFAMVGLISKTGPIANDIIGV